MTVEHGDLEERLANALKAAAASIPDEPPFEWREVVRRRPPAPVRRGRSHSRGRVWIVSAAAVVIVLAGVVVAVTMSATSHGTPTYASRLLTAAPQKASAPTAGAGDWRLLGYVSDSIGR